VSPSVWSAVERSRHAWALFGCSAASFRASETDWPELVPKYRELYSGRAYLGADDVKPVKRRVAALARELGVADRRVQPVEPEAEPEQLALAV